MTGNLRETVEPRVGRGSPPWGWRRLSLVVAVLLVVVGTLNAAFHARADEATRLQAAAGELRGHLQEESNLQWRALAEQGPALDVARRLGDVRRAEYELLAEVATHLPASAEPFAATMARYHEAIDRELGMLAVGSIDAALDYEREVTIPLFDELDGLLSAVGDDAAYSAARARGRATSTMVMALLGALFAIASLLRRAQAGHEAAATAIAERLEREREATASLERARAMIHQQAIHDPLTGLRNRLGLREGIRELVDAGPTTLCVVFVDLDYFKEVNDRFGHEAGDQVLCSIADAIRGAVRAGELAARVGGDEFTVVASVATAEEGRLVAARIADRVLAACVEHGRGTALGASVGVAVGPTDRADALLVEADDDMYQHKRARDLGAEVPR